jgi:CysZ protein
MDLIRGMVYNIRGLGMSLRTGKLLFWGLVRFLLILLIMSVLAGLILAYHQSIMDLFWTRPESRWLLWIWHLLSWFVSIFLIAVSGLLSFLLSQILFSVLIMDLMSRITERKVTGQVRTPEGASFWKQFISMITQEIPRCFVPLLLSMIVMVLGWMTPLGPVVTLLSSGLAVTFLSWDNTDLTPARNLVPFKKRFKFLMKTVLFHLGFGLPFLIPGLNLFFLAFAPVGATLYYLDKQAGAEKSQAG